MPIALMPEQVIRQHLEKIQNAIANRLSAGALMPERRQQYAEEVTALKKEADRITEDPGAFHVMEPWEIPDPDQRAIHVALNVNSVFATAPEDHLLTECLIDYWKNTLAETAAAQDRSRWEKQCRKMRQDAEILRRTKAPPVIIPAEYQGSTPQQMVFAIQKRLAGLAQKQANGKPDPRNPWAKAYTEAMQQVNQRALWLLDESDNGIDWTRNEPGETNSVRAIKFKFREEFELLNVQIAQLEATGP